MSLKIQHTASCKLYTSPRLQIESTAQSRFPIVIFILILVYTTQQDRDLCVYTFFFFLVHDGVCCADPWAFVVYTMRSGELDIIADFDERNKKGRAL